MHERGAAIYQEVEFGTDVSPSALAAAQLTFNAPGLFHGVPVPAGLVGQVITIPLAHLQALVVNLIPC